ncbi:MAG TPA: hypothetical protein PKI94_04660 [Candidatus Gastranaerophilaceae bacterium]|nr:hypothetical protein [Candidatus Gastranaerophilaceae bacterium]
MKINLISNFKDSYKGNYPLTFKNNFPQYRPLKDELSIRQRFEDDDLDISDEIELLSSKYLTKDENKNIFAHKATSNEIKKMNKALFLYPELIDEIYTTENKFGSLPSYTMDSKKIKEINKVLNPKTFAEVYSHKNNFGDTIMSYFAMNSKMKEEINGLMRKYTKDSKYLTPSTSLKLLENNRIYLDDENMYRLFILSGRNS